MGLRYLGNINKPGYNPLASNITTGVNVVQYQGIFTTQQQLQAITTGQWVTDPVFDYSTLLLQADGIANGSQNNTFLDSSTNNFTITRNGNTTQGAFSPFSLQPGAWANYFDGSSAFSVAYNSGFAPGSGDFTVEAWVCLTSLPSAGQMFLGNLSDSTGDGDWTLFYRGGGIDRFEFACSSNGLVAGLQRAYKSGIPTLGRWYHVVGVKSGSTLSCYVDGVKGVDATLATVNNGNLTLNIGQGASSTGRVYGYISNARIVKGTAVYSGNYFNVPTAPLTAITNTQLLTCQSNRFVDNSTNNFSITVAAGTPSVQAFSPFAPQFQYTATGTGGSGYFDGSGDFVSAADNTALQLGSVDFTIEFWAYFPSGFSGTKWIGGKGDAASTTGSAFSLYSTGFDFYSGSTTYTLTAPTWIASQWYHIAIVRNGTASNNLKLYINGAVQSQASVSTNTINTGGANALKIGEYSSGSPVSYISGYRLVKGTAVYTAAFTPPTAPPTAVTNTNLLLNFTNAGILDGTMKNNLETVGNASVSTSVVKYGSGSMYFDGTGDWVQIPNNPSYNFGTGDFTIECWLYPTAAGVGTIIAKRSGSNTAWLQLYYDSTNKIGFVVSFNGTTWGINSIGTINVPLNAWVHVALVRFGSSFKTYINGINDISATNTGSINFPSDAVTVGAGATSGIQTLTGYIDDLRVTAGIARYTQNFIPPSVALPRQ